MRLGLTSLHWFLSAHPEGLPSALLLALNTGKPEQPTGEMIVRIRDLSRDHIDQLGVAIIAVHREYFGTMNGRELASFVHQVAGGDRDRV